MDSGPDFADSVREAARKSILFLPHAVRQMSRLDRMISPAEVRQVLLAGSVIEDYPDDPRGHSCLLVGWGNDGRAIHVVCSPRSDYLAIITAYLPSGDEWVDNYRRRAKAPKP